MSQPKDNPIPQRDTFVARNRGRILTGIGVVTAGLIALPHIQRPDITPPTPIYSSPYPALSKDTLTPSPEITDGEAIIANEAKRLGVSFDENEIALWRNSYPRRQNPITITEREVNIADLNIAEVFLLMNKSNNPHFQNVMDTFFSLLQEGRISAKAYNKLPSKTFDEKDSTAVAIPVAQDGKLHFHIAVDAGEVINNSSAPILALIFTHELTHIQDFLALVSQPQYANLTAEEKVKVINAMKENDESFVAEEARAYARQAQAYIYEYGLGFRGGVYTSHNKLAIAFIQSGKNPNGKEWRDFIKAGR